VTAANSRWRSGGRSEQGFWCQGGTACLAGNLVELPRQLQRLRILDESLEARLLLPIETRCRFPSCSSSRDDWGGWRCHPALIDGFHPSLAGKMSREAPCLGLFLGGMPSRTRLVRTSELRLFPEIEIQTRFLVVKIWREVQRSLPSHSAASFCRQGQGRPLEFFRRRGPSQGDGHRCGLAWKGPGVQTACVDVDGTRDTARM